MIIVSNPFASSTNPSLIVLDHESGKITQEIFIPTVWGDTSTTGLAYWEEKNVVLVGTGTGYILSFPIARDLLGGWSLFYSPKCPPENNIHDITIVGNRLLVASTTGDRAFEIDLEMRVSTAHYHMDPVRNCDTRHVNGACWYQEKLLLSMFCLEGKSADDAWNRVPKEGGLIYNWTDKRPFLTNLTLPHSLRIIDDKLCFVESRLNRLHLGDDKFDFPIEKTFMRGLCKVGDNYWVGHSDIRHRGDDTPGGLHTGVGHAFLEVLPESRIIPLPTQEVYDILYVPRR
jgi:hypothetical protein